MNLTTGWTVRGLNPGGVRDFPHPSRPAVVPTQRSVRCVPGRGINHPPLSSAEVKETVKLLLHWALKVCSRVNLKP